MPGLSEKTRVVQNGWFRFISAPDLSVFELRRPSRTDVRREHRRVPEVPSMTHTYALMKVSRETFKEIHAKLLEAGYEEQVHDDGTTLDMHGIALIQGTP